MSTEFEREIGSSMMPNENPGDLVENEKWIEACKKRLTILRPETEEAKHEFLEEAARTLKIGQEELITKAKKQFRDNYIEDDEKAIRREETKIAAYGKPQEYLKKAEEAAEALLAENTSSVKPIDNDFPAILSILLITKQTRTSQAKRAEKALSKISEYDIMRTIRMMFENKDSIEELYKAWGKPWGDINALRSEARRRGIREELLEVHAIQSEEADRLQQVGKKVVEGGRKGARVASSGSEKSRRQDPVRKRYDELMKEPHNMSESEVKKQLAREFRISLSTVRRYLQEI